MIREQLEKYKGKLKPFTELRLHENRETSIGLMNGNLIRNEKKTTNGVSARMNKDGYWGFASNSEINEESINQVLEYAEKNATFLASKGEGKPNFDKSEPASSNHDLVTKKARKSQKEILDFLNDLDNYTKEKYGDLETRLFMYISREIEKNLLTSEGTTAYLNWPTSFIYCEFATVKDGEPTEIREIFEADGNFEETFESYKDLLPSVDKLYDELILKSNGVTPVAGMHEVILDADLAGILAHEALGHTVEADLVKGGSVAGDFLNQKVASDLITLVDFAHTYDNKIAPCPIFIDDEGVEATDAVIIDKGYLKGYMHNRDSAQEMSMNLTGNARAWSFSDEPLIRMRNTAILPGESTLEEMIASIEKGYYFTKTGNGQADTTGEFMFGVNGGYEIINGKLGRAIKDTTISGQAFEVLSSVTMISNEMKWTTAGMCGKKQPIPTAMGGPAIKCKINVGGQ